MNGISPVAQRCWRLARSLGKALAFLAVAAGYTLYAGLAVRRRRTEARSRARAIHQQRGTRMLLRLLGVRVRMTGNLRTLTEDSRPRLLVCNHLGVLDPFVLAATLRMALVGKAEIADWPGAGWVARTMGVVFVERDGSLAQVEAFVERVQQRLRSGVDVLVFPEGTTNGRPNVLPFQTVAFQSVAGQEGEVVLPLYLHVRSVEGQAATGPRRQRVIWAEGAETFLAHCWQLLALRGVDMEIHVGEPISAEGRDRKTLARRAQAQVEALARDALGETTLGETACDEEHTPVQAPSE